MSPFAAVTLLNGSVTLRRAAAADLPELIALLAADQLAIGRDGIDTPADLDHYQNAFAAIDRDAAQLLLVAATPTKIVGTLQLTVIPGLSRRGSLRGQIEAVRVHERHRGLGLG